jgi:uncharacterized OB-fold protein
MTASKPVPVPTPATLPFWQACARHSLELQRCERCARFFFYPRVACPTCGRPDRVAWQAVSGRGTLHSFVISHLRAPGFEEEMPFVIAVVELAEGPRMLGNLSGVPADPELLPLDLPLVVDFDDRPGGTVPVWRPVA